MTHLYWLTLVWHDSYVWLIYFECLFWDVFTRVTWLTDVWLCCSLMQAAGWGRAHASAQTHRHTYTHMRFLSLTRKYTRVRKHLATHTHAHTHTHTHTHKHTNTPKHTHTNAHTHTHTFSLSHTHTKTQTHTYTHARTHAHTHTHKHTHIVFYTINTTIMFWVSWLFMSSTTIWNDDVLACPPWTLEMTHFDLQTYTQTVHRD